MTYNKRALLTLTAVTICGVAASVAGAAISPPRATGMTVRHARATRVMRYEPAASSNWAGYAVSAPGAEGSSDPSVPPQSSAPVSFTSVTGTWKQPAASCDRGRPAYSAVWVGLGGFSPDSPALEQIGTDADCTAAGKPRYYAWYELVPAAPVELKLKIVPGDTITTSVNVTGSAVLVQIKNRTRHTSFTRKLAMAAPAPDLSSAEWIVEAPSACTQNGHCQVLPLANFGSVTFTKSATWGNGTPGTISYPAWSATAIQLVPESSDATGGRITNQTASAAPTSLSPDGRSFAVSWQPAA